VSIPDITLVEIDAVFVQQLPVFFLKRASTMVLLLAVNVLQNGLNLTRAYRKRAIAALPEKGPIASVNLLDPLRGRFLYLLDHLSLGKSPRERRRNVNVIGNTADAHEFPAKVTADCCQVSMHARPHI